MPACTGKRLQCRLEINDASINQLMTERKYVLSIAGHDPSGGAGILADIKTFESNKTYGLGVISANTFQNDRQFAAVDWIPVEKIMQQIQLLADRFSVTWVKIGLIESLEALQQVIAFCRKVWSNCRIIWDPILSASAGFEFHSRLQAQKISAVLQQVFLVTPNIPEASQLSQAESADNSAKLLTRYCNVFLKGGHDESKPGYDTLYLTDGKQYSFRPKVKDVRSKHGSGCVLSSAITANLAKGERLQRACLLAKEYTGKFLKSNETLLGYHKL